MCAGENAPARSGNVGRMVMSNSATSACVALNFEGALVPEWIQLLPQGSSIEGRDGRRWTLDDPQRVVATFNAEGRDLPVDLNHATQIKGPKGEPAPAVGWIKALDVRDGAIWGQVAWNDAGRTAVAAQEYRFISPVFRFDPKTRSVTRMAGAGLTNNPNLNLAALNHEEAAVKETDMDAAVLEALGLNSDASAADAVAAIAKLKEERTTALNSASFPDPEKFVPKADHELALNQIAELEAQEKAREEEAINTAVDAAIEAGKIAPSSRDFHIAAVKASGVEAFNTALAGLPKIAAPSGLDDKEPGKGAPKLSTEETAVCQQLGISEEDFLAAKSEE